MTKETSPSILDKISSLCDDKSSLQARLALASFPSHSSLSIITEKGLALFEYLQLVSPLLIATLMLNFNKDSALFQAVFLLARLINPAFWMSFDKTGALENMLLIIVCFFTVAKLLLFLYILNRCSRSTEVSSGGLVTIWRVLMRFQSRITYFYMSSFYIAAIRVVDWEAYKNTDDQSIAIQIISYAFIALELLLALIPKIYYHDMLPTKSFLSAKENTIEIMTLVQKVITQILTGGLHSSIPGFNWILASVNICIDVFRITNFFIRLPFYNFKALYFQGWLLMMVASLNLSYFISLIFKESDSSFHSIRCSLIIWGILLCFGIIVSNNFLKKAFLRIMCNPSLNSPNLLIHRVVALKELQKSTVMDCSQNHGKNDFDLLTLKTFNSHIKRILWVGDDENNFSSTNILCKNFLEKLQDKFPKNKFIKIFLAEFYFKQTKIYGDPIKICLNLQQSRNIKLKINAELLLIRIQNQIKNKAKTLNHSHPLDLLNFVSEHAFTAKLKQNMLKQTDLQIKICSEILKDSPDLELLYQNSQKAQIIRQIITKKINQISTKISDFHIESTLLSAEYSLSLNHSIPDFLHFTKLSTQKFRKYQKTFAQENLCPENAFQENVGFLKVSGAKGEAGKIIYATKQIGNILGGDFDRYSGLFLPQRTPPIIRQIYVERWKQLSENPETSSFGKIGRAFFFHFDGYLVEIEYFMDIHPFATQGFAFVFILRPVVSNREHLLLYENGDIDSASKGLIEKLGLKPQEKRINIGNLNDDLIEANQAFNITAFPQKYALKELDEAKEIYSKYITEGVDLSIKSQHNPALSYSYKCKIKNLTFGSLLVKVLTFEENKRENRTIEGQQNASENFIIEEEMAQEHLLLISPTTQGDGPQSTERNLITSKSRNHHPNLFIQTLKRLEDGLPRLSSFSSDISDEDDEEMIDRKAKTNKNLGQIVQEKKISSLFQVSLDFKYYSNTLKTLIWGCYISLGLLMILKVSVKTTSGNYMDSLVAKKDIFSNNGYRSYLLVETSGMTRYVWQFTSGTLNISDYPASFAKSLDATKNFVKGNIEDLRETNGELLRASGILNEEERDAVFAKNVKIYDTYFDATVQSYIMMDSLQATDRLIEAALAVYYSFFDLTFNPEMTARAQFLFRNSLNELVLTNTQLSGTMVDSFDEQFSDLEALSIHFAVIFSVLLCALLGVLVFFLWKQYSADVFFISAVSRLNQNRIQAIHKELVNFRKYLKQQDNNSIEEIDRNLVKSIKAREETNISMSSRRETVKTPDNKALRKRYLRDTLWIVIVLLALVVLITFNALMVDTRLHKIKSAQEKLYFINHIRIQMSLASTTFRELAATNNTASVENKKALAELGILLERLVTIRTEIYSTLLTEDIVGDNPEIETLLLGEGCSLLDSTVSVLCETLKGQGISTGFVNLMNKFEDFLREKVETFKQSDKSAEALADLQMKDYRVRGVIYILSLYEMELLWTRMNNFFIDRVQADREGSKLSLSVFLLIVIFLGIVGWKLVLKGLRESVNQLKNILRVFPAGLVLANFTLKAFLMKTSKVGLEYFRNET